MPPKTHTGYTVVISACTGVHLEPPSAFQFTLSRPESPTDPTEPYSCTIPELSLPPIHVSGTKAGSPYPSVGNQSPGSLQHSFPGQGSKALFSIGNLAEQLGMDGSKLGRALKRALWSRNPRAPLPWALSAAKAVWEESVHFSSIHPCQ